MILGIGHDLAHLPRFLHLLNTRSHRRVTRLAQRILHETHEAPNFHSKRDSPSNNKTAAALYLANIWACKEAVFKSLEPRDQRDCRFNLWYKTTTPEGRPMIQCDTYAKAHPNEQFLLSVSHDGDYLSAFIVRSSSSSSSGSSLKS